MPSEEEVDCLTTRFLESTPRRVLAKIEKNNIGIGMVLRYLVEVGHPVSAGEISRYMNVSTARVAVLLRTMYKKGLIIKSGDSSDARKISVTLSEKGLEHSRQVKEELLDLMRAIIERIGIERLESFLAIAEEINAVVAKKIEEREA